jgi:hypothetical protein
MDRSSVRFASPPQAQGTAILVDDVGWSRKGEV